MRKLIIHTNIKMTEDRSSKLVGRKEIIIKFTAKRKTNSFLLISRYCGKRSENLVIGIARQKPDD